MAVADTLRGIITADASGVEKAVSDADQQLGSLSDRAVATGERMQSAGRSMTMGISAPLAAMGGLAVRQAAQFDQSMQQSIAVMGDVDEAMREKLEATAREVATTTTRSHQEAADSFYFLASAGLSATEAMEAMPQVAAFAEAGQMNMADATDVATNVMSAYNIEAENMSRVTDVMTETVTNHNQTMEGMSAAFQNAAPAAASMGVELDELAALTGRLGDVGIQGAEAGTALSSIMRRFAKRSGEAGQVLDELNIQTTDAQGNLLPLTEIFAQLESEQLSAAESAALFGEQAAAGNALLNAGAENLEAYRTAIDDSAGATQSLAETQRETLNAELQQTRSQLNDAAITIGADVMPMVSTLAGHVGTLADRFGNLSDRQQKVILAAGALGVALPPLIWGLGTLVTSASALSSAYATLAGVSLSTLVPSLGAVSTAGIATQVALGPITVPIWAIIAAIGALVGATAGLWYAWDNNVLGIQDTTEAAFQRIKGWFTTAPAWMLVLLGPIGQLYLAWRENLFGVQDVVGTVFDWIGDKIGWLIDRIDSLPGINFGDDDVEIDEGAVEAEGAAAGEAYAASFEGAGEPDVAAMTPGAGMGVDAGEEIKGEMTPAIREALEDGVDGYVSDPDDIEDAPTAINGALFDAVSRQQGGATAESLGVSEAEFKTLMQRFSGSDGSTSSTPSADLVAGASTSASPSAGSAGMSTQEFKTALREVLDGLRLDTRLDTDQRGFEQFIEEIVDARLAEAGQGR
ncbi:phage tail tape measure protein, TP901 family [Halorubrum aidingense JCM 13560]|uniref:Phage tail tape measure protein, TP901 family n=1 Tax=Halorubrum aidingense JCM 13560 TaxID=1230454 RepID=M0PI80_9EURY|nr:phage tail tape measure protein [Halorubrum aidingense]EMA69324.1 phage tail tape measure protein, TP901 family [Halorubrum aidingense JCM 13560]